MLYRYLFYTLLILGLGLAACSGSKKTSARNAKHSKVDKHSANLKTRYASELGVRASDLKNDQLYVFIDDWKGTPYRYGGTSQSGVDCSGFIGALYRSVYQKPTPRTTGELSKQAKPVAKRNLNEGDLVFFDIDGKKSAHVGVYLINNKFVHASSSKGVIISDLENPYYVKAFAKGGKL